MSDDSLTDDFNVDEFLNTPLIDFLPAPQPTTPTTADRLGVDQVFDVDDFLATDAQAFVTAERAMKTDPQTVNDSGGGLAELGEGLLLGAVTEFADSPIELAKGMGRGTLRLIGSLGAMSQAFIEGNIDEEGNFRSVPTNPGTGAIRERALENLRTIFERNGLNPDKAFLPDADIIGIPGKPLFQFLRLSEAFSKPNPTKKDDEESINSWRKFNKGIRDGTLGPSKAWRNFFNEVSAKPLLKSDVENAAWAERPLSKVISIGGEALPSTLAAIGATMATKNPTMGAALLSGSEGAEFFARQREAGITAERAAEFAAPVGIAIFALERIGLGAISKNIFNASTRTALRRFVSGGSVEGLTEFLQNTVENMASHFNENLGRGDLRDRWGEAHPAAKEALIHMFDNWQRAVIGGVFAGGGVSAVIGTTNANGMSTEQTQEKRDELEQHLINTGDTAAEAATKVENARFDEDMDVSNIKSDLLTPEGASIFAEANPILAAEIAQKETPSRSQIKKGLQTEEVWNSFERQQFAQALRDITGLEAVAPEPLVPEGEPLTTETISIPRTGLVEQRQKTAAALEAELDEIISPIAVTEEIELQPEVRARVAAEQQAARAEVDVAARGIEEARRQPLEEAAAVPLRGVAEPVDTAAAPVTEVGEPGVPLDQMKKEALIKVATDLGLKGVKGKRNDVIRDLIRAEQAKVPAVKAEPPLVPLTTDQKKQIKVEVDTAAIPVAELNPAIPDKQIEKAQGKGMLNQNIQKMSDPLINELNDFGGESVQPAQEQVDEAAEAIRDLEESQQVIAEGEKVMPVFAGLGAPIRVRGEDDIAQNESFDDIVPREVQDRMKNAFGKRKKPLLEKLTEVKEVLKGKLRPQEHIPVTKAFGSVNELFRKFKNIENVALERTKDSLAVITESLVGPNQQSLFNWKVLLDNQLRALDRGEPLRFGWEKHGRAGLESAKRKVDAMVEATPQVKQAVENRNKVIQALARDLVKEDLLDKEILDDVDGYFHQQVIQFQQGQNFAERIGAKRATATFQKKRVKGVDLEFLGEEFDYNTDYFEAESDFFHSAYKQLEKEKWLGDLKRIEDIQGDLVTTAEENGVSWESLVPDTHEVWQPEPGNVFYRAIGISEQVIEQIHNGVYDFHNIPNDIRQLIAIAPKGKPMVLRSEVARQLRSMEKATPSNLVSTILKSAMTLWKIRQIIGPDRVLGYNLRNTAGDVDPVLGGRAGAFKKTGESVQELWNFYKQKGPKTQGINESIEHGVIGSSMIESEVPSDIKDIALFKRFYAGGQKNLLSAPVDLVVKYFTLAKRFTEFRENIMRFAAYKSYKEDLDAGREITHFGGSNGQIVLEIQRDLGNAAAAAHLARNLLGDYQNLSVMGNFLRSQVMPFWSWNEVNLKRYPRMLTNAIESGGLKTDNKAGAALFSGLAVAQVSAWFAMQHLFNNLVMGDEEEELSRFDRANPHIVMGRNPDGTIRVLRNTSALGDFLEWGGINTLVSLLPQWQADQIDTKTLVSEVLKDAPNKLIQGLRPDMKGVAEVSSGFSLFPDIFNPRRAPRGEIATGTVGLTDWYRMLRGSVIGGASFKDLMPGRKPHFWQKVVGFGVTDPRKNALGDMFDLRDKFIRSKGKDVSVPSKISAVRDMRRSAENEDYQSFLKARKTYIKNGNTFKNFLNSIRNTDPTKKIGKALLPEFETEFLNDLQRAKLGVARQYAHDLEIQMWSWWVTAADLDTDPAVRATFDEQFAKTISSKARLLSRKRPTRKAKGKTFQETRDKWQADQDATQLWFQERDIRPGSVGVQNAIRLLEPRERQRFNSRFK